MYYYNVLQIIRKLVNIIIREDEEKGGKMGGQDGRLVGIAWEIQQLLEKYNINEN